MTRGVVVARSYLVRLSRTHEVIARHSAGSLSSLIEPSRIENHGVTANETRRWFGRKAAKMGQHMQSLEEQAHRKSQKEAKERRKKKKKQGKDTVPSAAGDDEEPDADFVFEEFELEDAGDDNASIPSLPDPAKVKQRMARVVEVLEESFKAIRGAEPTPELFDTISVQAYGEVVPLSTVAQVVIVSPTLATATCFDPSLAPDVRNAIRDALELNPQLEGDNEVRVPLPRVSMETRQKTVKQIGKQAESARTHIRNLRRKAMDTVKKGKDGKLEGISKDDAFRVSKEIDAVTDNANKMLNDAVQAKQDSVMVV